MKIKTADLIGPALDWAVAKCESIEVEYIDNGITRCLLRASPFTGMYRPSFDWSQGGPPLERGKLELRCNDYEWQAFCFGFPVAKAHSGRRGWASGPTPLIAAMRCLVASRLGVEVDVPEELLR